MATVVITPDAQAEVDALPLAIRGRIATVIVRLERWPAVSGAKPLTGDLHGSYRIRTGDYRVVFRVNADRANPADTVVTIWKVGHRGSVYE